MTLDIGIITILMFLTLFVGMAWGIDLAFLLGAIAVGFAIFLWGINGVSAAVGQIFNYMSMYTLVCMPLFVFMAMVLERAGIAEALYSTMHHWMGRLRGGLCIGTVAICTLFGAMSGSSGLAVSTMGIIALPAMLKRKYNKHIVLGGIMAGASLASLIPPSIIMIFYALFAGESIGAMFIGGIIPGLLLSSFFMTYIAIRCAKNPSLGPPVSSDEQVGWMEKLALLKAVILPIFMVLTISGVIFTGIATPTEAAGVGALGALICAAINGKISLKLIGEAALRTLSITTMLMWILAGAAGFAVIYTGLGATNLMANLVAGVGVDRWVVLIAMMISLLLLGCVLSNMAIIMIAAPIYIPIITALGFNPLWFGIIFVINMETGLLTPPFGFTLFYMRAVTPSEISMGDIYRSVLPFVALKVSGLALVMLFPQLCLWLPSLMFRAAVH